MTNRKKRLKKGIESLGKQIKLHEEKLAKAKKDDNIGLVSYYMGELESMKKALREKKRILDKGG